MTHRDGFPRLSARSAWRGDAGHRKPCATPSESLGKPPPVGQANRRRASESLDDVPHRPRLPSYPADRLPDLYGSLSALLGINPLLKVRPRRRPPVASRTPQGPDAFCRQRRRPVDAPRVLSAGPVSKVVGSPRRPWHREPGERRSRARAWGPGAFPIRSRRAKTGAGDENRGLRHGPEAGGMYSIFRPRDESDFFHIGKCPGHGL